MLQARSHVPYVIHRASVPMQMQSYGQVIPPVKGLDHVLMCGFHDLAEDPDLFTICRKHT
jgi:hypothetical protein